MVVQRLKSFRVQRLRGQIFPFYLALKGRSILLSTGQRPVGCIRDMYMDIGYYVYGMQETGGVVLRFRVSEFPLLRHSLFFYITFTFTIEDLNSVYGICT